MQGRSRMGAVAIAAGLVLVGMAADKEAVMATTAKGTFEVTLVPQEDPGGGKAIGRMTIDKAFKGDLEGSSKGQMLSVMTEVKGSAGYVAMETVTGTLGGRMGTFALQHSGTMDRGKPGLNIAVVPDSGTGELVGLAGALTIRIADGKHSYEFDYTLPDAAH